MPGVPEKQTSASVLTSGDGREAQPAALSDLAHRLARQQVVERSPGIKPWLLEDLESYEEVTRKGVRYFRMAADEQLTLSSAAEWVLDNHYLVYQVVRLIREDMPERFYRQLPKLTSGPFQGYPRVYALALEVNIVEEALMDLDRVRDFLRAYQSERPLTMGELWAFPIMLRLSVLQGLTQALRRLAHLPPGEGHQDSDLRFTELSELIKDDEVVANSFISLRRLETEDWKDFFEDLSVTERILSGDPVDVYRHMDFETRDRYRKVVEAISLVSGLDEQHVAGEAVRLAQAAYARHDLMTDWKPGVQRPPGSEEVYLHRPGPDGRQDGWLPRKTHVGFFLVADGRAELERALGYRPSGWLALRRWINTHPALVYLGSIGALTWLLEALLVVYLLLTGASVGQQVVAATLGLILAMTASVSFVNWVITSLLPPRVLPKMDFDEGIPEDFLTLVTVPAMLSSEEEIDSLLQQLELHYLRNPDRRLLFALLTDFGDAPSQEMPEDEGLLEQARRGVQRLNERYLQDGQGPFCLFHRGRRWNPREGVWMGWERKRGKLAELNHLILGDRETTFTVKEGALVLLPQVQFVITLDADTILPPGSARRLVAALAHPLNRARFDAQTGTVRSGYTLLQPRTEIGPTSANLSHFTRIFSGDTGLDLYTLAVSDVYQDFFGAGIYVGKGIYDVRSFERSLRGRAPENALLSHDLFEGVHGRVGLVSDIVLIEDYPPNYLVQMSRLHRWTRGDWQILPWLFPLVPGEGGRILRNRLKLIDRWKIFDNLRRSLVAPTLLALFMFAWLWLPGSPLVWTLAGLATLAVPLFTDVLAAVVQLAQGTNARLAVRPVRDSFLRWFLAVIFLPYQAQLELDAVLTSLARLLIARRGMLNWTTAAQSVRLIGDQVTEQAAWLLMFSAPLLSALLLVAVAFTRPAALLAAGPLLALWLVSPQVAYWISQPVRFQPIPLSGEQRQELRSLARRTWLFFEQFVGPEDHWLPPDHFQESPLGTVAHRTSPTNIGLSMLSTLAAYDEGYIGSLELASRLRATFGSLSRLERYQGHFLNWYDTRSLEPLKPRYVSTVDSGNLIACLIALGQGCRSIADEMVLRPATWGGVLDTIGLLVDLLDTLAAGGLQFPQDGLHVHAREMRQRILAVREHPDAWLDLLDWLSGPALQTLEKRLSDLVEDCAAEMHPDDLRRLRLYNRSIRNLLEGITRDVELLLPWRLSLREAPPAPAGAVLRPAWDALLGSLPPVARLADIEGVTRQAAARLAEFRSTLENVSQPETLRDWCDALEERLDSARLASKALLIGFDELYRDGERYLWETDFTFLFDRERQVFHIGYNMEVGRLDDNYYDLLASEARIASLITIGKGDVPQSHWLHLSRPLTQVDGKRALLSWSGTMFEYLMPRLLLRTYEGTLLNQSEEAAVDRHIEYGQGRGTPWGASESGYYHFDANNVYQYRAFGVPGLGYKRGLGDDLVIAPYASLLALPIRPQAVMQNVYDLVGLGMLGTYGLYEAIDFTAGRVPLGQKYAQVREYMAHHQGMIFLSLINYFNGDVMVRRFHADPRIQAVQLLLQEQIPYGAPVEQPRMGENSAVRLVEPPVVTTPWAVGKQAIQPQAHILSNGRFTTLITSVGSGYSAWRDLALTRWRPDSTLNNWGTWIYVQDVDEPGQFWSACLQPAGVLSASQDTFFSPHMAEFRRRDGDIATVMEVTVAPEADVEVRRVTLTNYGNQTRRLRVNSFAEVVLAEQNSDLRHPAYNKLFIDSEWAAGENSLIFRHRPKSEQEEPIFLAHSLFVDPGQRLTRAYEADRRRFLGRGHTARRPQALLSGEWLTGAAGPTLDPIMALGQVLILEPNASAQVTFLTAAARTRLETLEIVQRYSTWQVIQRAFELAHSQSEIELRQLGLSSPKLEKINQLLTFLIYPNAVLRARPEILAANRKGQPALWAYGISGDYPILLLRVRSLEERNLVGDALQAHAYWRNRDVKVDLVILNEQGISYGQEINQYLHRLITRTNSGAWLNRHGGIFILSADQLGDSDRILLETAARVILDSDHGTLEEQLTGLEQLPTRLPPLYPTRQPGEEVEGTPPLLRPEGLQFDNGLGGFSPDGQEYVIYLEPDAWTPLPWTNVIANESFGFLATEAGLGASWAINSGENRLTPWSNDAVSDVPAEAIYLRDEETVEVWSSTPLPSRDDQPYLVRHGAGYTEYEHHSHGLKQRLRVFAAPEDPVKVLQLRVENTWNRPRRITATYFATWVLGVYREISQPFVVPEYDGESQALLAFNRYNNEFAGRVAFAAASIPLHGLTADRTEFLGRTGGLRRPAALNRVGLGSNVDAGVDPCVALQIHLDLLPGGVEEVYFLLGEGEDREDSLRLVKQYRDPHQVRTAWEGVNRLWDDILGTVTVETPDPGMDVVLNRWLLYQALSCRIWGRTAFYQSSGAYGYRDQLQDVLSLLYARPDLAREHLLRAARHQFEAGDVLHWWHPPTGRGVRTRFSDDLLWLPFAVAHYVEFTGDEGVLDEREPFKKGEPLAPDQNDRYGMYEDTAQTYTLYEHCLRAIEKGTTHGRHNLPLMGTGDWNDGMNRVGASGRGESVWLGWFLHDVLVRFTRICERRGEAAQAGVYRQRAENLRAALHESAWDGAWYLRAYYDNGHPLGSSQNRECQIDSLAQSWAVLSGAGDPERIQQALHEVNERLIHPDDGLMLLFTPPFDRTPRDPGYIKGYLPGVRENGGQYTHAAIWTAWAYAELGQGDEAQALFSLLNPVYHSETPEKVSTYQVEPYVIVADIYSVPPNVGRGGWTWYTGSSSWMYRLGVEAILGLRLTRDGIRLDPRIPAGWPGYRITYRRGDTVYQIQVENPDAVNHGVKLLCLDGEEVPDGKVPFLSDGAEHQVRVVLG